MTPFQEILCCLSAVKNDLELSLRLMQRYCRDEDSKWLINQLIWTKFHVFYDEWKRLNAPAREDVNIRDTLRVAAPAIRQIRQSEHAIYRLRNSFLAHPLRDKDGRLIANISEFIGINKIPVAYDHTMFLGNCAVYAIAVVHKRHWAELQSALAIINGFTDKVPEIGYRTGADCEKALVEVMKEMYRLDSALIESVFAGADENTTRLFNIARETE